MISHDTNLPRPYSLGFRVQGTNGLWMNDGNHIYLEGISKKPHTWDDFKEYQDKFEALFGSLAAYPVGISDAVNPQQRLLYPK